jgi:hypothetical protein
MLALDEQSALRRHPAAGNCRRADSAPLSALAGDALDSRFRSWRGRSGRRYVFSVYDRLSCPAYEDAVMMVIAAAPEDQQRIVAISLTGCFPGIDLAAAGRLHAADSRIEFHIHLLARSRADRLAVIADLAHLCRN